MNAGYKLKHIVRQIDPNPSGLALYLVKPSLLVKRLTSCLLLGWHLYRVIRTDRILYLFHTVPNVLMCLLCMHFLKVCAFM